MSDKKISKKKKEELTENQINDIKNPILIRFSLFERQLFHAAVATMQKYLYEYSLIDSRFVDDKYQLKKYNDWNLNVSFSFYVYYVKKHRKFRQVIKAYQHYHTLYNTKKKELLTKYAKFDKDTNKYVLLEGTQEFLDYHVEQKSLTNTIIQLDIEKLTPKDIIMDFKQLYNHYFDCCIFERDIKQSDVWNYSTLFDLLEDIFDMDEIQTLKYLEEVDNMVNKNFGHE